jgi:Trk K+ transport system NAD-binding subunit
LLQAQNNSPLLKQPPVDFYKGSTGGGGAVTSFMRRVSKSISGENRDGPQLHLDPSESERPQVIGDTSPDNGDEEAQNSSQIREGTETPQDQLPEEEAWKDLQVLFPDPKQQANGRTATREFLAAMEIAPKSNFFGRTVAEAGLDRLPGVFLVSIERPDDTTQPNAALGGDANSVRTIDPVFTTITPETPLQDGDVLWFAGGAQSVGDLRKIPGLVSAENKEVKKINAKVHDRRLVEAVIARRGPLVGKTVKQVRFRTRYGAAVISVHRDGNKVHEHPGLIRLQAGDVLLLEAGPTFIKGNADRDRAFSLLAEVEDSAPPRLQLLIPAIVITVAMLAV